MADNSKISELKRRKGELVKKIEKTGKMTNSDSYNLTLLDHEIFMAKHPRLKKFNDWLRPEVSAKSDIVTNIKNAMIRFPRYVATLPAALANDYFLMAADSCWSFKNTMKYHPDTPRFVRKIANFFDRKGKKSTENIVMENEASSPSNTPQISQDVIRQLQGLGPKPATPVRQTQVNGNIVSGMSRREL